MDAIDNADHGASVYNHPSANRPTASLSQTPPHRVGQEGRGRNPRAFVGSPLPTTPSTGAPGPRPGPPATPPSAPPPSSPGGSRGPGNGLKLQPIQYPAPPPSPSGGNGNQGPQAQ